MIKKRLRLPWLLILFNFWSQTVSGQEMQRIAHVVADTAIKQENHNSNYFKPATLILPGTFLAYGGLKPVVSGIARLDNDIMQQVKKNYPGFHTNADSYLMWVPSASLYVMDAFKVKTRHSFQEHLLIDAGSFLLTGGIGYIMRKVTENIEEYNTQDTRFPSGHAANAFRGGRNCIPGIKARPQTFFV